MEFKAWDKIARLSREMVITEKIDGTNSIIAITEDNTIYAGSRIRWLWNSTQDKLYNDNAGFAAWVLKNQEELLKLGEGYHYGEWWGNGIQRGYGLKNKRFSLFNTGRWTSEFNLGLSRTTECIEVPVCHVVPVLYRGEFDTNIISQTLNNLKEIGSFAYPGFNDPEGIVIFHTASETMFKKTIKNDESPKSLVKE